jgi:glutaconate CoA-transferase subunit A
MNTARMICMKDSSKVMTLDQATQLLVPDGSQLYLEGILANRLPMAAVHEIIRAQRRKLRLISAPNGLAVDQLIGAGCVEEIEFYFLGFMTNKGFQTMRRFRSAVENRTIQAKESMGYAICMALRAGAYGIPFIPIPDFRGSDLIEVREDYRIMPSPYNSDEVTVIVPALQPDVLLLHAHTADDHGNVALDEPWPIFTLTTAQACQKVLVTVEQVVPTGTLDPHRITIPHFLVDAVVEVPLGAAPTALNKRYEVDDAHIALYQRYAETAEGFNHYLKEYILGCTNHAAFIEKIGQPQAWQGGPD